MTRALTLARLSKRSMPARRSCPEKPERDVRDVTSTYVESGSIRVSWWWQLLHDVSIAVAQEYLHPNVFLT